MKQEINKLEKESECTEKFEKQKLVLFCDPKYPIRFIELFFHYVKSYINIFVTSHVHSSVQHFPNELSDFCLEYKKENQINDIHLTIIWKEIGIDPIMQLPGMHKIIGEINIARYLNRVIENCYPHILRYESKGVLYANEIDNYLEKIHSFLHTNVYQAIHKKSLYIMGEDISIIDILLESSEKYKLCKQK